MTNINWLGLKNVISMFFKLFRKSFKLGNFSRGRTLKNVNYFAMSNPFFCTINFLLLFLHRGSFASITNPKLFEALSHYLISLIIVCS